MARVWVAAGLDPSAGAGLLADQMAVRSTGAWMQGVVTAHTVQNLRQCLSVLPVEPALLRQQWQALIDEGLPDVCKLGMTGSAEMLDWLLDQMARHGVPVVVDPVLQASSGTALADREWLSVLRAQAGRVALLTPNLDEVAALLGDARTDNLDEAASRLRAMGFHQVLIKGGHGRGEEKVDRLYRDGDLAGQWRWPALPGSFRGTGCRLASATAGWFAMGCDWPEAVERAGHWLHRLMAASLEEGAASGPYWAAGM